MHPILTNKYLYFSLLFLLSFNVYLPNAGNNSLSLPFNSSTIFTTSLIIFLGLYKVSINKKIVINRLALIFGLTIIALLTPNLWHKAPHFLLVAPKFIYIFIGFLYYIALLQLFGNKKSYSLLYFVCGATLISSFFSIYQNYLMGPNSYFIVDIEYGRPFGVFQQVNVLSSFMASGIAVSLYLLFIKGELNEKIKKLLYLNFFSTTWVLILTQSRIGYLAGAIIFTYYLFYFLKQKKHKALISIISIFCIAFTLAKLLPYGAGDEYETKREVITSPTVRFQIYKDSFELFLKKPLTGHGYGYFHYAITNYSAAKSSERNNLNIGRKLNHPHNEQLLWLVEGGIIPWLALTMLAFCFLLLVYKSKHYFKIPMLLMLLPIFLHTQVEHPFYQSFPHFITFITLVFVISKEMKFTEFSKTANPTIFKVGGLVTLILLTTYSFTALQTTNILYRYIYNEPNNHILLSQVLNPIAEYKFIEIRTNTLKLDIAIFNGDKKEISKFIDWSHEFLKAYPSDYIYFETIRAMKTLLMTEQAEKLNNTAKYLYPQNNSWETGIWAPSDN